MADKVGREFLHEANLGEYVLHFCLDRDILIDHCYLLCIEGELPLFNIDTHPELMNSFLDLCANLCNSIHLVHWRGHTLHSLAHLVKLLDTLMVWGILRVVHATTDLTEGDFRLLLELGVALICVGALLGQIEDIGLVKSVIEVFDLFTDHFFFAHRLH